MLEIPVTALRFYQGEYRRAEMVYFRDFFRFIRHSINVGRTRLQDCSAIHVSGRTIDGRLHR